MREILKSGGTRLPAEFIGTDTERTSAELDDFRTGDTWIVEDTTTKEVTGMYIFGTSDWIEL